MESKNLWQKISEVMKDVQYLQKDDKVGFGNNSYKAISEEKVTETLRASLIKNGLVILPVEQEHSREDVLIKDKDGNDKLNRLSTVNTKYKIVNIDNPIEFEILVSSGTGVDSQDKGVGKAMTYSYKYMLLRTFAIPTGEDPDKVSSEELDHQLVNKPNGSTNKKDKTPVSIPTDLNPKNDLIDKTQRSSLFFNANNNTEVVKKILMSHGYTKSEQIKKSEFNSILEEIKKAVAV